MFKPGTQILYVPNHADGNIGHPDVEHGFVVGPAGKDAYFCRYWTKKQPGVLRTTANSERTNAENLVEFTSVGQSIVDDLMAVLAPPVPAKPVKLEVQDHVQKTKTEEPKVKSE